MNSPWDAPKEYTVSIATNNIRKAIVEASNALSDWIEQSYLTIGDEDDESDFNQFALEMMRVLASHPEQLSWTSPEAEMPEETDASEIVE